MTLFLTAGNNTIERVFVPVPLDQKTRHRSHPIEVYLFNLARKLRAESTTFGFPATGGEKPKAR